MFAFKYNIHIAVQIKSWQLSVQDLFEVELSANSRVTDSLIQNKKIYYSLFKHKSTQLGR